MGLTTMMTITTIKKFEAKHMVQLEDGVVEYWGKGEGAVGGGSVSFSDVSSLLGLRFLYVLSFGQGVVCIR